MLRKNGATPGMLQKTVFKILRAKFKVTTEPPQKAFTGDNGRRNNKDPPTGLKRSPQDARGSYLLVWVCCADTTAVLRGMSSGLVCGRVYRDRWFYTAPEPRKMSFSLSLSLSPRIPREEKEGGGGGHDGCHASTISIPQARVHFPRLLLLAGGLLD